MTSGDTATQDHIILELDGLASGDYTLKVSADGPAAYTLYPGIGSTGETEIDLSRAAVLSINPDRVDLEGNNDTADEAYTLAGIQDISKVFGLTIDTAMDVDWFTFSLRDEGTTADTISLLRTNSDSATLTFSLYDAEGNQLVNENGDIITTDGDPASPYFYKGDTGQAAFVKISLEGLEKGDYTLKVDADEPTYYEIYPHIGDAGYTLKDLSGKSASGISLAILEKDTPYLLRVTSPNLVPTIYSLEFILDTSGQSNVQDMGQRQDQVRKDVILGGPGHVVLQGGMGEDWIFGGPGNDVISGGFDRQAPDLLFGEAGDDTFQLIPDDLPLMENSDKTYVPTFVDTMFGGDGEDRVLFLGGDTDNLGRDVPDFVAIRYNRILHRYEFTSLVWDTENQEFMLETIPGAVIQARDVPKESSTGASAYDGRLAENVIFDIILDNVTYTVTAPHNAGDGLLTAEKAPDMTSTSVTESFLVTIGNQIPVKVTVNSGLLAENEPSSFIPSGSFGLTLTEEGAPSSYTLDLDSADTQDNTNIEGLASDLNKALDALSLTNKVTWLISEGHLALVALENSNVSGMALGNDDLVEVLGFESEQTAGGTIDDLVPAVNEAIRSTTLAVYGPGKRVTRVRRHR